MTFNSNWGAYVISKLEGRVEIRNEGITGIFVRVNTDKAKAMIKELIDERSMTAAIVDDNTVFIPSWWILNHNLKFEKKWSGKSSKLWLDYQLQLCA